MEDYYLAKAALFEPHRTRTPVVVVDDAWGQRLAAELGRRAITVSTRDDMSATWRAREIAVGEQGRSTFRVLGSRGGLSPPHAEFRAGTTSRMPWWHW